MINFAKVEGIKHKHVRMGYLNHKFSRLKIVSYCSHLVRNSTSFLKLGTK